MTRRERLERKLEKRQDWAEGARTKSDEAFSRAHERAQAIPLGQPILVGHHSEKRDRRYREKIRAGMDRGVELHKKAEDHTAKARGLAIALERSIFDDDPDALEKLREKIEGLEKMCEQSQAINKAWRKGGQEQVAAEFGEVLAASAAKLMAQCRWLKSPMTTTNDRAEIRRCKERIKKIEARRSREGAAFEAGGLLVARHAHIDWCRVTFAEKPDREVLSALREAGYRWGQGSWQGYLSKLPAAVVELETAARPEPYTDPCYACDGPPTGHRDRTAEGGQVEPACDRHAEVKA